MNAKQAKPEKANSRKEVFVMRKETMIVLGLISAVGILLARLASSADKEKPMVKYPDDYRHWTHVKSTVIQQGHPLYDSLGGIQHIYANWRAFKAMKSGKSFTDGAVLVFDLLKAKQENNRLLKGPANLLV
jgi:hypothetical protein